MPDYVIETAQLRKSFKGHEALCGLDLAVPAGSIFGFLGRNGAGKTTTIRLLMALLRADAGEVRVLGREVHGLTADPEIRRRIGFVTEDKELYPYMSVAQVIRFTRPFFPSWRDDLERRYLAEFELPQDRKVPDLSKGMRSKLMLLLALSRGAELLILDEPLEGLDPAGVDDMLKTLASLPIEGVTVFFSSHQIGDVEQVADRICMVEAGRSVVAGVLDDLKLRYQRLRVVFNERAPEHVSWGEGVEHVQQNGRMLSLLVSRNADAVLQQARSLPGATVERFPVSLKEIFLEHARGH